MKTSNILCLFRSQLEQKTAELISKGIITSLAAQQQIAAGSLEPGLDPSRAVHLETEFREAKVCTVLMVLLISYILFYL